jgi:protein-tyrosine-phosphatase
VTVFNGRVRLAPTYRVWHEGDPADPRALRTLKDHGYDGTHHRAREFRPECFSDSRA